MEAVPTGWRVQAEASAGGEDRPDVFAYRDYREYLLDVIQYRATRRKTYGRTDFAKALGFSSASGLNMIFSGQRELRSPYLDRCVRNLRLKSQERLYFEALVRAAGLAPAARRSFLREAEILTGAWKPPEQTEGLRLIDFMILQQILCLVHRPMTVTEIRSLFRYDVQEDEILEILKWMREHGYVEVGQGKYKAIRSVMTSQDEVPNVSLRKVHVDAGRLAEQALESDPIENREFQTFHFTMDKKRLPELKHRMKALVLDVLREFETELDATTAVQMHFHLFEVINGNGCVYEEGETDMTPGDLGRILIPLVWVAFAPLSWAGVSGVGNTTDITIQLDLTRQTGVQVLRQVSSFDLEDVTGDAEAKDLYTRCRDAMYRGAVASQFVIVDEIPDGDGYMALARRRSPTEIEISRRQLEQLRDTGNLSGGVLLSVFLHEVAHDCRIGQKTIDDSYDPLINRMVQGVLSAAHRVEDSAFQDLEFVAKVKSGEAVTIADLSPGSRSVLSDAYINYLGDWIFENLKERFRYRPAPATDFYATQETSVYPGWAHVKEAMASVTPEVEALVFGVMRASFEEKSFSVYRDFHRQALPTTLTCKEGLDGVENLSFADCVLQVNWGSLPIASLQSGQQKIQFQVDSLSRVRITRIEFGSFPGRAPSYMNITLYRALKNDPCDAPSKYEIQSSVCRLVNRQRKRKEAEPLVLDRELSRVAQKHAEDMVKRGYFSHESPEGDTMSSRLKDAEISYGHAGENIAKGYATPREVMEGWMDSPGHRRNILYQPFRKIGIGVYEDHWVQVFTD